MEPTPFQRKVYAACKRIPVGSVATYAELARMIGAPGAARAVGNALNRNPYREVPCHRVIRSDGSVGGYARGRSKKIELLRGEGVRIRDGRVIRRKGWI